MKLKKVKCPLPDCDAIHPIGHSSAGVTMIFCSTWRTNIFCVSDVAKNWVDKHIVAKKG